MSGKIKDISLQYILLSNIYILCSCLALLFGDVSLLVLVTNFTSRGLFLALLYVLLRKAVIYLLHYLMEPKWPKTETLLDLLREEDEAMTKIDLFRSLGHFSWLANYTTAAQIIDFLSS